MPIEVRIAGHVFPSKEAAIAHCQAILNQPELEITGDDAVFVAAILHARPDKVAEMKGRRVVRYVRRKHRYPTSCFFAELSDGYLLDFSFMKFINAYPEPTCG